MSRGDLFGNASEGTVRQDVGATGNRIVVEATYHTLQSVECAPEPQPRCGQPGLSPDEWDGSAVVESGTEILPRKVSAEISFFATIAPVLGAFFCFLETKSLLPNAGALAEAVEAVEDEIVASAEDRSHWDPAKHFVMAAQDA